MKFQIFIILFFIYLLNFINCDGGINLVGLQVDTTSVTVKTFTFNGVSGSSIFPGKKIIKLDNCTPFRVSAYEESFIVSTVKGTDYYLLIANNQETLLYGIDLETGNKFIDGYSPNPDLLYMYGLVYDSKSDQLIALSSMNYDALEPLFDVVLIDPSSGEISKNLTVGNTGFENGWYSGLYTFSQSKSELYVLFQSMDDQTNNTISGITTVSTIDGTFINNIWINSTNNFIYNFVYDETTNMILATMTQYNGKDLEFVSIDPTTGNYKIINNNVDQVCAGSGPVVVNDPTNNNNSLFISPGKKPTPSHSLEIVDTLTGKILKEELDILIDISYLNNY